MRRMLLTLLVITAGLIWATAPAWATPTGYTDGTETYPYICTDDHTVCTNEDGTGFGPIPYGPVWVTECEVIEFDPPTIVWVTIHVDYGADGTVDTYRVVPYERTTPAVVESDITDLLADHTGELWLTWNFGSGETAHLPFDCTPDDPTTPTSSSTTTSTTISNTDSSTEAPTTTTTTTTIAANADTTELPRTGSTTLPLGIAGLALIAAGLTLRGRRHA